MQEEGGVSHILAEKRGVSFTLFQKMHENSIFSPRTGGGGVRRVRPMLDPPLTYVMLWVKEQAAQPELTIIQCGR